MFATLEEVHGSRILQVPEATPLIPKGGVIGGSPVIGRGGGHPPPNGLHWFLKH